MITRTIKYLFGTSLIAALAVVTPDQSHAANLVSLASFNGANCFPDAGLITDANGNLFGTTRGGGASNSGTVFQIEKTATGYASTPTTLVSFNVTTAQTRWPA